MEISVIFVIRKNFKEVRVSHHKKPLRISFGRNAVKWKSHFPHVLNKIFSGGWKPDYCKARQKVAILVPFRDREEDLKVFLYNMHPFLQKQLLDYSIFIIEQVCNGANNTICFYFLLRSIIIRRMQFQLLDIAIEFALNVFLEFAGFSDKNICHYNKRVWTHNLLCQRQGCYHSASKTHVRDRIFKLTPIHASVIYQIPWIRWIHWISIHFRGNSNICKWAQNEYPNLSQLSKQSFSANKITLRNALYK